MPTPQAIERALATVQPGWKKTGGLFPGAVRIEDYRPEFPLPSRQPSPVRELPNGEERQP